MITVGGVARRAGSRRRHERQQGESERGGAHQVDLHGQPLGLPHDARVVDQHRHGRLVLAERRGDVRRARGPVGVVLDERHGGRRGGSRVPGDGVALLDGGRHERLPKVRRQPPTPCLVPRGDHDVVPAERQQPRELGPDPARGAGHHGDLAPAAMAPDGAPRFPSAEQPRPRPARRA